MDANKDSVIIATKGSYWRIINITVNDESYMNQAEYLSSLDKSSFIEDVFHIERRDSKTLVIQWMIGLQSGNYFDAITVIQAGQG